MGLRGNLVHRLDVHRRLIVKTGVLPDQRHVERGELFVRGKGGEVALQEAPAFHEDHRLSLAVVALFDQGEGVVRSGHVATGDAPIWHIDVRRLYEGMDGPDSSDLTAHAGRYGRLMVGREDDAPVRGAVVVDRNMEAAVDVTRSTRNARPLLTGGPLQGDVRLPGPLHQTGGLRRRAQEYEKRD